MESTGARLFGLEDSEVSQRRAYVHRVKRELKVSPNVDVTPRTMLTALGYSGRTRRETCTFKEGFKYRLCVSIGVEISGEGAGLNR